MVFHQVVQKSILWVCAGMLYRSKPLHMLYEKGEVIIVRNRRRSAEKEILSQRPQKPVRACPPALEWLAEAAGANVRIAVVGQSRAMVENHRGVMAFGPQCVRVRTAQGSVSIRGEKLVICELRRDGLIVTGRIASIDWEGGEAHA